MDRVKITKEDDQISHLLALLFSGFVRDRASDSSHALMTSTNLKPRSWYSFKIDSCAGMAAKRESFFTI